MNNQTFHSSNNNGTQIIIDMEDAKHTTAVIKGLVQLVKMNEDKLNHDDCNFLILRFGQLNEQGEFIEDHHNQYKFFNTVVEKYPELMPEILEYVKLFTLELTPRSGPPAGMYAITILAERDIKYVKDFLLFMQMCDLNHATDHYYCIQGVLNSLEWGPEKLELANYFINAPGQKLPSEYLNLTNISPEYFDLIMKEFDGGDFFIYPQDILDMVFPNIETELLEERYEAIPVDKYPTYKYYTTGEF